MNLCIPIDDDRGLESHVSAHFGSASAFMVIDTSDGACRVIDNHHQHHAHGACQPLAALAGEHLDAIVVGGIGMGALSKLHAGGLTVLRAMHLTVAETLDAFKGGQLHRVAPEDACRGHHHE